MVLLEEKIGFKIVDELCCVLIKLGLIFFFFMDKNNKVVLRNIDDVVVEECGCK